MLASGRNRTEPVSVPFIRLPELPPTEGDLISFDFIQKLSTYSAPCQKNIKTRR